MAAGVNYDFRTATTADVVDSLVFEFFPDQQSFTFNFFINGDELPEGTEGFRLGSAPYRGQQLPGPTYQPPSGINAHVDTEIIIIDNDGKFCVSLYDITLFVFAVAVVGFEQLNYTVNESVGFQEVCVRVLNPPSNEELVSNITLVYQTRAGTAGIIILSLKSLYYAWQLQNTDFLDFSPITINLHQFAPSLPEAGVIRRACFNVFITDDGFYENTESFDIALSPQSEVRVDPLVTKIIIIDNDGKFCDKHSKFLLQLYFPLQLL